MKYIDAEKLIAEIERWRDKAKEKYNESTYSMGRCDALAEFRNHIVSLQQEQPEVDLEKEIENYWLATDWCNILQLKKFKVIARYFYGLGLNAKRRNDK